MRTAIEFRADCPGADLWKPAKGSRDASQVRRLQALAAIYGGASRWQAAAVGGWSTFRPGSGKRWMMIGARRYQPSSFSRRFRWSACFSGFVRRSSRMFRSFHCTAGSAAAEGRPMASKSGAPFTSVSRNCAALWFSLDWTSWISLTRTASRSAIVTASAVMPENSFTNRSPSGDRFGSSNSCGGRFELAT